MVIGDFVDLVEFFQGNDEDADDDASGQYRQQKNYC